MISIVVQISVMVLVVQEVEQLRPLSLALDKELPRSLVVRSHLPLNCCHCFGVVTPDCPHARCRQPVELRMTVNHLLGQYSAS